MVHNKNALVIQCTDCPKLLSDKVLKYLINNGYSQRYDRCVLAGASLGYNTNCNQITKEDTSKKWTEFIDNHIMISDNLHTINEIIVIDHMGCDAYKKQLNNNNNIEPNAEYAAHIDQLNTFANTINKKFSQVPRAAIQPRYTVKTMVLKLDGTVDDEPGRIWKVDSKMKSYEKGDVAVIGDGLVNGNVNVKERIPEPPSTLIPINDRKYYLSRFGGNFTSTDFIQIAQSSENKNTWYIKLLVDGPEFAKLTGGFALGVAFPTEWSGFLKLENSKFSIGVRISSVIEVPQFKPEQYWLIPFPFHGKKLNVTFTTVT
jgi:hypothetical protein